MYHLHEEAVRAYQQIYGIGYPLPTYEEWMASQQLTHQIAHQSHTITQSQPGFVQNPSQCHSGYLVNQSQYHSSYVADQSQSQTRSVASHKSRSHSRDVQNPIRATQTPAVDSAKDHKETENFENTVTKPRWQEDETRALVHSWREKHKLLKTHNSQAAWTFIVNEVNKVNKNSGGKPRSIDQCKDKVRRMTDDYNSAKLNNKKSGVDPIFSSYFNIFDEVLGKRDITKMPYLQESLEKSDKDGKSEIAGAGGKHKIAEEDGKHKSESKFDKFLSKTMKMMQDAEERQGKFLKEFFESQAASEREERKNEREFQLQMMKIIAGVSTVDKKDGDKKETKKNDTEKKESDNQQK